MSDNDSRYDGRIDVVPRELPSDMNTDARTSAQKAKVNDVLIAIERHATMIGADLMERLDARIPHAAPFAATIEVDDSEPCFVALVRPTVGTETASSAGEIRVEEVTSAISEAVTTVVSGNATETGRWQLVVDVTRHVDKVPAGAANRHPAPQRLRLVAGLVALAGLSAAVYLWTEGVF